MGSQMAKAYIELYTLSVDIMVFVVVTLSFDANTEKKKRAKTALLESNFENRLSFVRESRLFLHNHV